ncbi:GAF domain-containing protein [Thioflavicoccus mobilis]|nr:GAF domain-containing protein [Thioflavicoccus mobilis]
MIDKFSKWLLRRSPGTRIFFAALSNAAVFYFAAFLSHSVSSTLAQQKYWKFGIHAFIFVLSIAVVWLIAKLVHQRYRAIIEGAELKRVVTLDSYQKCDSVTVQEAESLSACGKDLPGCVVNNWRGACERIQQYVQSAYSVLATSYGRSSITENRIDFEVTFMTKSLRDGKVTIPASANRDGRKPRTMQLRESNPDIYEQSVTAQIYRAESPRMIITTDTSDPQYASLYPDQKLRIRSAIVHPVLSPDHKLLGTLVAHCDRVRFFKNEDEKYWHDFLEIFSKRIAVEVMRLHVLHQLRTSNQPIECRDPSDAPF